MKWFDNWFNKKWAQARLHHSHTVYLSEVEPANKLSTSRPINSNGMNFTVYYANGGYVIETRMYDKKHDENNLNLHIITVDKDLGEELGKIITYENLRT